MLSTDWKYVEENDSIKKKEIKWDKGYEKFLNAVSSSWFWAEPPESPPRPRLQLCELVESHSI